MTENEKQLKETERVLKRLHQNGEITPEAFTILNDRNKQAINYTRCCKSDSEQLCDKDTQNKALETLSKQAQDLNMGYN